MNKKYIRRALIFFGIALLFFCGALWHQRYVTAGQVRGQFVFEQTRNNIRRLAKIKMTTPENGEINIYYKNGDWLFKEAKDYFANVHRLSEFYNMANNSLIEAVRPAATAELNDKNLTVETGTKIVTYDMADQVLDELIIGKHSNGASAYAYNPQNKGYYYIISDVGSFSGKAEDWVPYPLLTIDERMIKAVKTEKIVLDRAQIEQLQTQSQPAIQKMLSVLSFIGYDGVSVKSELLSDEAQNIQPHKIEIIMAGGLIYEFEIYEIEDLYWLSIKLKADKIVYKDVPSFIDNNQKYFADWLFLMNTRQGKTLYEM